MQRFPDCFLHKIPKPKDGLKHSEWKVWDDSGNLLYMLN